MAENEELQKNNETSTEDKPDIKKLKSKVDKEWYKEPEKMPHGDPLDMDYRWVRASDMSLIEHLNNEYVDMGRPKVIDTESAWDFVEMVVVAWARRWPKEFKELKEMAKEERDSRGTEFGTKKSPRFDSGQTRYLAVIPQKVQKMLRVFFPWQKFDKDFMHEWARRLPAFRVAEKI